MVVLSKYGGGFYEYDPTHLVEIKSIFPARPYTARTGMPKHIEWPEFRRGQRIAKAVLDEGTSCASAVKKYASILGMPERTKKERIVKYLNVMGFYEEIFDKNLGTWDGFFDNSWQSFLREYTNYECTAHMFKVLSDRKN